MRSLKITVWILFFMPLYLTAQSQQEGVLSGSIESNSIMYKSDDKTGAELPDDKLGSNNYLKLDYTRGNITLGLQYEGYFPALVGFNKQLEGSKVANRYLKYRGDQLSFVVGHFYEQFGSGLILRSYEERALGINNAIDGLNVMLRPVDGVTIKGLVGKHRKYFESGKGKISGADAEIDINKFITELPLDINIGGSWVSKYEVNTGATEVPTTVDSYALRSQILKGGFSFYGEYVHKENDPSVINEFLEKSGEALLINSGFTTKGFGLNISMRRLEQMDFRSERAANGSALMINYLPSLTRQHKYSLALLNPYATNSIGEIGGQFDLYYKIKKGSALGGKYGTKIQVNMSQFHSLNETGDWLDKGDDKLFSDFSIDIEKKWNKKLKTVASYIQQSYNKGIISGDYMIPTIKVQILVGEVQYRLAKKTTVRMEVQHLSTEQDEKNWASALLELTYAPKWSFFASDMYNYGDTKIHYYNIGTSYSKGNTRLALAYARNRKGIQCVGGICKDMPAYTGFNFSLSTRF